MPEMAVKGGHQSVREQLTVALVGEMRIMGAKGDVRVTWNARDADEVASARSQFEDLRGKGFLAYAVQEGEGSRGEQIREFDPHAQKIILAPPLAGGCA